MHSFKLTESHFSQIFEELSGKFNLFGPKRLSGKGRFSDQDLITYGRLDSFDDLELTEKSSISPKSIVFPADETTFFFNQEEFTEPKLSEVVDTIVFLRPCDLNGFKRLDKMFLENGGCVDPYYKRRRDKIHFFMIECKTSFENCFCVSMDSNKAEDYALAIRFESEAVLVQIKDESFNSFFAKNTEKSDFAPEFVKENQKKVCVPEVDKMPPDLYKDQLWEEYDSRCIACGRCNTSCITCSCFSTVDIFYPDSRQCGERRRVWDGCHLDGFCEMAGGHSFREKKGDRMRFKTFHKIYDFKKRFNFNMCVGCGRCDDVCPEYISFSSCINKVTDRLKVGEKHGK